MFKKKLIKRIYQTTVSKGILVNTDLQIYVLNILRDSLIICTWKHIYTDIIDVIAEEHSIAGKYIQKR